MRLSVWGFAAAASLFACLSPVAALAADAPEAPAAAVDFRITGHWTGAKLRCQKDEGKMVRCGTPAPFEITFADDGTGTTPDENLPQQFAWRWLSAKELGMTPRSGGKEIKLFAVEHEEESILSFQAYVFLPTGDPNVPAEVHYIHYVFDVSRAD